MEQIKQFLKMDSAGGILLMLATILAIVSANTPLDDIYSYILNIPVEVQVGELEIHKPLLLWVNDGLMAVFFFHVGLELKRELVGGELSSPDKIIFPAFAAIGGMVVPAAIYSWFNWGDELAMQGWAIPAATDIAFALGVLTLLGDRVPNALKIFLVSLAIIDDIGAIIIIALFYTSDLSTISLSIAAVCLVILFIINRRGVTSVPAYVLVGVVMWVSVLKSGVHATLAGVALALFIPHKVDNGSSPVDRLIHELHGSITFFILPIFAFMNAGVVLNKEAFGMVFTSIPAGIGAGLFFGKQVGVFLFCWLAVKLRLARKPDVSWSQIYGIACLCGIGFTMSLFIGSLAFEKSGGENMALDRLGIIFGSIVSAIWGYWILNKCLPQKAASD